jgi:hypothetical protein
MPARRERATSLQFSDPRVRYGEVNSFRQFSITP